MPHYMMVPVDKLQEPLNPMRQETLEEGLDDLRSSIAKDGLQEPIGVLQLVDGNFRIIFGHRRSICVTQLGWSFVPAMVYQEGEADENVLMANENLQRRDANDAEEARMWARLLPGDPEGTIGLARKYNVAEQRIQRLLICLQGDEQVFALLAQKKLSVAQAYEINQFEAKSYRTQAIELCLVEGWGGERVRKWRTDMKRQGIDLHYDVAPEAFDMAKLAAPKEPEEMCGFGNHMVPVSQKKSMAICNGHMDLIVKGFQLAGEMDIIETAGYLPHYKKLLREAERMLNDGGVTVRPDNAGGSGSGVSGV